MSSEGKCDYAKKWLCGCTVIMMTIILIPSLVIIYGGSGCYLVEMTGTGDSALVEDSSGLYFLEINESGKCDNASAGWTWMDVAFVIIGFKSILVLTHICHYCSWTNHKVKEKVRTNVEVE